MIGLAQETNGTDWRIATEKPDVNPPVAAIEWLATAGPTAQQSVVGNGTMTAGISPYGEVVMLKWPRVSGNDHLLHKTKNPPSMGAADARIRGANPYHGIFQGLEYRDGTRCVRTWFRDAEWNTRQRWVSELAPVLETVYTHASLGATVTIRDGIRPDESAFVRTIDILWPTPKRPTEACLVSIAGFAPCIEEDTRSANTDSSGDGYGTGGWEWGKTLNAGVAMEQAGVVTVGNGTHLRSALVRAKPATMTLRTLGDLLSESPAWAFDFEHDEVGLGAWAMRVPAVFIPDAAKRQQYLREVMPAIARAADLLVAWKDSDGRNPSAREDDIPWHSQTGFGAGCGLVGLKAALHAADELNWDPAASACWQARAEELCRVITCHCGMALAHLPNRH